VTAILVLENLRYAYGGAGTWALDGIDLVLEPGQVVGVTGANGSGKSTLCLVAAGLAPAATGGRMEGTVRLGDIDVRRLRSHEAARLAGILLGDPSTQLSATAATAWEEIAFGPRNLGLPVVEIVDRVEAALAALGIEALAPRDPLLLSGGEGQLVALASVVAMRPALLVLDEPTSHLDPVGSRLVGDAIRRIARAGSTAVLIAEHRTALLSGLADEIVVLEAGRIARQGPAGDVLADPGLTALGVEPPPAVRLARIVQAHGLRLDPAILEGLG
jgi:energy-coupling factor transport system ATP-binding protein